MRITREEQMALYALVTSLRSTCGRKSVGAIIELEGKVIATGYAGQPSGFPHCSEACMQEHSGGCSRTIHAETNAIAYAARHGISTHKATLYCTLSPCENCAKAIISSGIHRVKYIEQYRDTSGIGLLQQAGIPCEIQSVNYVHFINLHQQYASGVKDPIARELRLSGMPPPLKT